MENSSAPLSAARRLALTAALLAALGAVLFTGWPQRADNALFSRLDQAAESRLDAAFVKAAKAFAVAKIFNGVVSTIQESEIHLEPFGLGVDFAPGQMLDPVNDLVERASWVFLASMTSIGVQRFALAVAPWLGLEVLLALALAVAALNLWWRDTPLARGRVAARLVALAVVVRLLVPGAAILGGYVDQRFLDVIYGDDLRYLDQAQDEGSEIEQDIQGLEGDLRGRADELSGQVQPDEPGWLDRVNPLPALSGALGALGRLRGQSEALSERIADFVGSVSERMVNLITLFVIQTMILPLATLWLLMGVCRFILGRASPFAPDGVFARKMLGKTRD